MNGTARRLLEALGDTAPAFVPRRAGELPGRTRRVLAALADTPLRRDADEYRPRPARTASPRLVLAAVLTGLLAVGVDQSATGVAAVRIASALGGLDELAWLSTPYLAAFLVTGFIARRAADRIGIRRCLLFALAALAAGAAMTVVAPAMPWLAVARAWQGAAAGAVAVLAVRLLVEVPEPHARGRYLGAHAAAYGAMTVAGPVLGGAAADAGPRWLFAAEAVLATLGFAFAAAVVPGRTSRSPDRTPGAGAGSLLLVLVPLVVVTGAGARWGWGSAAAVLCYTLSALGIVVFAAVTGSAGDRAVLPPRLLRERWSAPSLVGAFLAGTIVPAVFVLTPVHLQVVLGLSPGAAGLLVTPAALAMLAASAAARPLLIRTGQGRAVAVTGALLAVAGLGSFAWAGTAAGAAVIVGCGMLTGAGLGLVNPILTDLLVSGASFSQWNSASTALNVARLSGVFVGTGGYLAVLFAAPGRPSATATTVAFLAAAGVALAAVVAVLFLRDTRSGLGPPPAADDREGRPVPRVTGSLYHWPQTGF
ncbi:MFS transporter [Amycolatopsis sp. H6(2020)]|nr:MFS transporter [Amycolatopsis sp. H6(2020)]